MLEVMSSEDEDGLFSSDEEGEHNVLRPSLDVVAQSSSGMLVESYLADAELARTALSCRLSMDLQCHGMPDAWQSEDCQKVLK